MSFRLRQGCDGQDGGQAVCSYAQRALYPLTIPKMGIIVPNMGTSEKVHGLGEALFSKTRRQVLGFLFTNPDRSFYVNEIVQHVAMGIGTVQRELEKLSRAGILSIRRIGNQKHYQANRNSPVFEELYGIVIKTFGVSDIVRNTLRDFEEDIEAAFIYGSVAKGTDHASSDIDILIVSDHLEYGDVMTILPELESRIGRTVNPALFRRSEIKKKIESDSGFFKRVMDQPKIFLIGAEDDLLGN